LIVGFFVGVFCIDGSADSVKQITLLFYGLISQCILNDLLGHNTAFSALAHDAELFANFTQIGGSTKDCIFDLVVGNSFAETNVHGFISGI
jgi:hypothetical protein